MWENGWEWRGGMRLVWWWHWNYFYPNRVAYSDLIRLSMGVTGVLTFRVARFIIASFFLWLRSSTGFAAVSSGGRITFPRPGPGSLPTGRTAGSPSCPFTPVTIFRSWNNKKLISFRAGLGDVLFVQGWLLHFLLSVFSLQGFPFFPAGHFKDLVWTPPRQSLLHLLHSPHPDCIWKPSNWVSNSAEN